jgi:hypothetical protein
MAAVAMFGLSGCVTQTTPVGVVSTTDHPATGDRRASEDPSVTDPCAMRLQDISGVLLQYFALNKRLPARLDELAPLADAGEALQFVCPASGKPYASDPQGLVLEGREKKIIIYDPTPAHRGSRWCVFMADDPRPGAAQSVEVLAVPEAIFQLYRPPGQ